MTSQYLYVCRHIILLLLSACALISPAFCQSAAPAPFAAPLRAQAPTQMPASTSVLKTVAAPESTGHLSLNIVIVSDLQQVPVLLTDFNISGPGAPQTVRTDASGNIDLDLPPGHYHIASVKPTVFKGQEYIWSKDCDLIAGQTTKALWTDADATDTAVPVSNVSSAGAIYAKVVSGIVTVEGDRGQGSGFVVDKSGLIVTCQHVVAGGRWAAVKFDQGIRLPAVIVDEDSTADVAVLAINPEAYSSFAVLPLADPTQGPLAQVGESVLAIGSPLHQEKILTTGIVSKVGKGVLISDVNINHGNSGGPLLNLDGDVIGITTFIDAGDPNGPGISGIVSIDQALPVLARAKQELPSVPVPSAEMLPDISQTPIPDAALEAVTMKQAHAYVDKGPKNFLTIVETPFYAAAAEIDYVDSVTAEERRRVGKRDASGIKDELVNSRTPVHAWEQYGLHLFDPIVEIEIVPDLKEKASSSWLRALTAFANGVNAATGNAAADQNLPSAKLEYRDDFWDMALYRDDTLVHPTFRQRDSVTAIEDDEVATVRDTATGGIYYYDPSVFAPGATLRIYSRRESDLNRWDVRTIPDKERKRIWDLFASYRSALDPSQQNVVVGLSNTVHTPPQAGAESSNSELMARYVGDVVTPGSSAPVSPQVVPAEASNGATVAAPSSTPPPSTAPPPAVPASVPTPRSAPVAETVVLTDGSTWVGTIDHQDDSFIYLKVSTGTKLIKKQDVSSISPPLQ
jgi:S1-C subfamily serine protease